MDLFMVATFGFDVLYAFLIVQLVQDAPLCTASDTDYFLKKCSREGSSGVAKKSVACIRSS